MKKLLGALILLLTCAGAYADEGGYHLDKAPSRVNDMPALQNGAKLFVNYCLNCHAASSMRYNRLHDIGLTDDQIRDNLLFNGGKVGDMMTVAMTTKDAKAWFGAAPPDLSVIARAKSANAGPSGSDYIYTYLRTFYRDNSRPTGWNNLVFPKVSMPHVLYERQGPRSLSAVVMDKDAKGQWQRVTTVYDETGAATVKTDAVAEFHGDAGEEDRFTTKNPAQSLAYDNDVADLTAFLTWMSEPSQEQRSRLGVWVMIFLAFFTFVTWRLNAVFWRDIK
jgi:ubiquinol-cytochrome c reductase cytochrome c1 subunit